MQPLLKASLEQGHFNCELTQGLKVMTLELAILWDLPAAGIPLPNPACDVQWLLTKIYMDDNVEVFLGTFEQMVLHESWPCDRWM